jgi:fructokinase
VVQSLGGYLGFVDGGSIADRIVPAALGEEAGPLGTLVMAQDRLRTA